jgi:probable F420-dependent oxidoreductase
MKFGLRYCNTGPYVDPRLAIELVQAGEEAGFESAWTVEHTVVPEGYQTRYPYSPSGKMAGGVDDFPLPDPLIWMAYVAGHTRRIKLATGILILPQHNPIVVAKQIASLDHMTEGRVILGVGVGWLREEFEALGANFDGRGAVTDEYIQVLRRLWQHGSSKFQGRFISFDSIYCEPRPKQDALPIVIGGHSEAAARRAGRFGDGFFPAREAPERLIAIAKSEAITRGRDPEALEITVSMPDEISSLSNYRDLGVDRVLVPVTGVTGMDAAIEGPEDVLKFKDLISRYTNE